MNYYGVTRSTDHLAHYGVKGMKWGVRRAIARGNQRAVDRHFRKAAKKLKKLQDIGLNSKKYAAKSAAYGAAAAGVGTLAVGGTKMAGKLITKAEPAMTSALAFLANHSPTVVKNGKRVPSGIMRNLATSSTRAQGLGNRVAEWGTKETGANILYPKGITSSNGKLVIKNGYKRLTNNDLYRLGAGVAAVGLAAKGAQNAYRAVKGAKYREKASRFKNEMDSTFKGTKYEGLYVVPPKRKKRRR